MTDHIDHADQINGSPQQPKLATAATAEINADASARLKLDDRADFERATRGRLAQLDPPIIGRESQRPVWDLERIAFLLADAPPEVNPSLWRQAQLNLEHGLFQVTDGIYQVRGYDLSNITFVRTDSG